MSTKTSKNDQRNQASALASGKKTRKGGKPVTPVKVGKDRNWGPIAMFAVVGVLAAAIIGYAFWAQRDAGNDPWQEQATEIEGVVDYRESRPEMLTNSHVQGPQQYEVQPPVGGDHNNVWQNCQGDIYDAPIASEHAVHSLEHGAIWVTYNPDLLPQSQVDQLAGMVEGNDMMLMSPFPELDAPISLQAWGYQLKVDDAGDSRINEFVRALRTNASIEPGATCSGGITSTGTVPQNVSGGMER